MIQIVISVYRTLARFRGAIRCIAAQSKLNRCMGLFSSKHVVRLR
jgi:hypothetical protein